VQSLSHTIQVNLQARIFYLVDNRYQLFDGVVHVLIIVPFEMLQALLPKGCGGGVDPMELVSLLRQKLLHGLVVKFD